MTKEELLKPRWKVIADFPGNTFYVGEIIEIPSQYILQQIVLQGNNYQSVDLDINPSFYPAIFKKLKWWEERKEEDLPKYVLWKPTNTIMKVSIYEKDYESNILRIFSIPRTNIFGKYGKDWGWIIHTEPSTKEEYEKQFTDRI